MQIGKDKRYIDNLLYGARPSPKIALAIEQATNGEVTVMELLFPEKNNLTTYQTD